MKSRLLLLAILGAAALPAVAEEPAFARACIKATQTEPGRMSNVEVAESSGDADVDAFAIKLVRGFKLQLKSAESVLRQEGFAIVDRFEDGSFATTLFSQGGRLVRGCNDFVPLDNGLGY